MLRHALQVLVIALSILSAGAVFECNAQSAPQPAPQTQSAAAVSQLSPAAGKKSAKAAQATAPAPAAQNQQPNAAPAQPAAQAPPTPVSGGAAAQAGVALAGGGQDSQAASTEAKEPNKVIWPFSGMTGYVDKQAAQRGFQIYSQVCSACHSMDLIAYRDLSKLGFTEAEIKKIASDKQVADTDDNGQPIQRPGKPFDYFVPPFPNVKAAAAANGGAAPPDLSLIIKAREQGPDYVYSILTGFGNPPAGETPIANKYYNPYFQGHWISMPPPLRDGAVSYQDGTTASLDQEARDVVTFLQWAAEPEMEQRHEMGLKVLVYLLILTAFTYIAKKRVWKKIKH